MLTTSDRGLFVWHELNTTDVSIADVFYSELIGWKSKPWEPNPSYTIWTLGREGRAGLYQIHELPNLVAPPPHWLNYIGTPDVDATVRQAVELGGKVVAPAADVPRVGRMAVLQDPQGAMFAVSARIERVRWKEPQVGDFSWHELLTSNWQTAFDFYSKLFGWEKMQAMDMGPQGTYQIFGTGGHQLGGMFTPGALPTGGPLWVPYILVRDVRKTAEATTQLGGMVAHGPMEVPGGDLVFTGLDRQGAMFAAQSKKRVPAARALTTKTTKSTKSTKKTRAVKTAKKATKRKTKVVKVRTSKKKTAKKPSRRR
ncbi:MAG: VOC family protein [Acidobacteria bacterium]|nr:MAG: VOC family protein [Acidobacteriota bacterium]